MSALRDSAQFGVGRWGENEVRAWLQAQPGHYVIPVNMIEDGGAPRAVNELSRLTLPDLGVLACGSGQWWEVKTKGRAVFYNATHTHRHGVEERLWHQYLEVERVSGWAGHLAIVQMDPPQLLAATFTRLRAVVSEHLGSTAAYGGQRMVFFDVNDFDILLSGQTWTTPAPPPLPVNTLHPWTETPLPDYRQGRLW